jgi:hypothetical protein
MVVLDDGVIVSTGEFPPVLHAYEPAPEAVSVVDSPAHNSVSPLTLRFGSAFTFTVTILVFVHPFASVPVTVYEVDCDGATTSLVPVPPVLQEYVDAPEAVSVVESFAHTEVLPDTQTKGNAFTAMVIVAVSLQMPLIPITVYVADIVGETISLVPFPPVLQA